MYNSGDMAHDDAVIHRHLKDGVEAVKRGNRVRGRELLLQVVQQDSGIEQAWWWLSRAVEDPQEELKALENVLFINPKHTEAQRRLLQLRQDQLAVAPSHTSSRNWRSLLPEVPREAEDGIGDPYQCAYCGLPTGLDDRRCPHCGGGLYARVSRSQTSEAFRLVFLLVGITLGIGLIELIVPVFALAVAQRRAAASAFEVMLQVPGAGLFLGNFLRLPQAAAQLLLRLLLVRAGVLFVLLLGAFERWTVAYYGLIVAMIADLLLNAYFVFSGYLGVLGALVNGGLALTIAILLFGMSYEFAVTYERLLVRPDKTARNAMDFYKRGHDYRKRGMWAMAVAQWRKAVGLAPRAPQFYKDLGIGYAQTRRYERSLRALEEAQHQDPADKEIAEIITLVRAKADTHRMLRR